MNKKEIEIRLLILKNEIDIEGIKNYFINDEIEEDIFTDYLNLHYAVDNAIYNNKKSLFERLVYLINKDRENEGKEKKIIADHDLVYLKLNYDIDINEFKKLFSLQKNIPMNDFLNMLGYVVKIRREVEKWEVKKR
ncbi:hypothetical protein HKL33_004896 [Salmonella enterica]|uniref:Uncharacterized protein n=1 Tax=Salmonella enterica subsp. enterica serovar Ohio TaxID=117541 RepID=A0A5W4F1U3_SALET|nr:hypothetical protein [Escherichia coli]EBF3593897.1 hypothetical protein [Salmonella enterica subsp. enterica serovar Berta]EBJ1750105.1 hypothetical protein [Salmonella enterica]EBW8258455.1 hypothetical protein [Salmonella enterica subsp. enterica serovar Ohio]EBZ9755791.1 hypothetical protein [Salmonella enterica subsp. enterica serovar Kentucky]EFM2835839.1 hypothetical protein [Salmonella enterica subsp. enterica serovar Typhimurium]ELD1287237.1 hypothetical protein [Salmonella enteri